MPDYPRVNPALYQRGPSVLGGTLATLGDLFLHAEERKAAREQAKYEQEDRELKRQQLQRQQQKELTAEEQTRKVESILSQHVTEDGTFDEDGAYKAIARQVSPSLAMQMKAEWAKLKGQPPEGFTLGEGQQRYDASGNMIAAGPQKQFAEPAGFTLGPGQQRFDAQGQPVASVDPAVAAASPFTLSPGQRRFDAQGKPIASVAPTTTSTGGVSAADKQMVAAIMKNPQIYAGLTPTVKSRLAVLLADAGFDFTGDAGSGKPPTGLQMRAMNFFNRAKQAAEELENLEEGIAKLDLAGQARLEYLPNFMQSQVGQSYVAAQRAFTEARLRKDSGAAIPDNEFKNDRQTYFVQPGDSATTIAQKKRQRAAVLASLGYESGSALSGFYGEDAPAILEKYKNEMRGAAPAANGKVRVIGRDGQPYEFPNQQSADAFKKAGG